MYAELIGLVANTLAIALPFAAFLYGVNIEFLIRFPPFVEQSPVHTQLLGERDDVVATLQPLDSHFRDVLRYRPIARFFATRSSLISAKCANVSVSFEGFSA